MPAGNFSFNGWNVSSITPTAARIEKVRSGLKASVDPVLASRKVKASGAEGGSPATVAQLMSQQGTTPPGTGEGQGKALTEGTMDYFKNAVEGLYKADGTPANDTALVDTALGSRAPSTIQPRRIVASGSVFQGPNIPDFLAGSVDALNSTAQMQNAARDALMAKVLQEAVGGNPLAWEAVRAGLVAPNAQVAFNASVAPQSVRVVGGGGSTAQQKPKTMQQLQAEADQKVADAEAYWSSKFPQSKYQGSAWMPAPATNAYPNYPIY